MKGEIKDVTEKSIEKEIRFSVDIDSIERLRSEVKDYKEKVRKDVKNLKKW